MTRCVANNAKGRVDDTMAKNQLTHVDASGRARMVNVSRKPPSHRTATAEGFVRLEPHVLAAIQEGEAPKGPVLEVARLAGICAAKRTGELIPLCHPLALEHVDVDCELCAEGVRIVARVELTGKTGVEMEALTAACVAALTIYDMTKALSKQTVIERIRLLEKRGGTSDKAKD